MLDPTLIQFCSAMHKMVDDFFMDWITNNKLNQDEWPVVMGWPDWEEQFKVYWSDK